MSARDDARDALLVSLAAGVELLLSTAIGVELRRPDRDLTKTDQLAEAGGRLRADREHLKRKFP